MPQLIHWRLFLPRSYKTAHHSCPRRSPRRLEKERGSLRGKRGGRHTATGAKANAERTWGERLSENESRNHAKVKLQTLGTQERKDRQTNQKVISDMESCFKRERSASAQEARDFYFAAGGC